MTCVFCTDVRNAGEVVAEDDKLWIVLHHDWAVRGHAMVVWKKHVENVADLTLDEYVHFAAAHHRAERALLAATGAERAIIIKLGIATPHLHIHIYPVAAALDRAAVMEIIEARVRQPVDETFIAELRERLAP
ncbi:MAG: HIT domain-containing protein [Acidobacteriota bacterium]